MRHALRRQRRAHAYRADARALRALAHARSVGGHGAVGDRNPPDAASTSACSCFVALLWESLGMDAPPRPSWWRREYVRLARDLEGETEYAPRGGAYLEYRGPLWRFVDERIADAEVRDLSALEACEEWCSGAYLLETVPSVLYILARHAGDPEEALVRAVNDTKDNDTIAAIVGAAVGRCTAPALPDRWVKQLVAVRESPTTARCSGSWLRARGAVGRVARSLHAGGRTLRRPRHEPDVGVERPRSAEESWR